MSTQYPLVELPKSIDLTLFLIREELKSRKVFNGLATGGFDHTPFRPHLDEAILKCTGLPTECDKTFEWYNALMDQHSELLTDKPATAVKEALEVYVQLLSSSFRAGKPAL